MPTNHPSFPTKSKLMAFLETGILLFNPICNGAKVVFKWRFLCIVWALFDDFKLAFFASRKLQLAAEFANPAVFYPDFIALFDLFYLVIP